MAQITGAEGSALCYLLADGPVTIDIKDNRQTRYLYHLRFNESGQIPTGWTTRSPTGNWPRSTSRTTPRRRTPG
jgi:hypothetical protein